MTNETKSKNVDRFIKTLLLGILVFSALYFASSVLIPLFFGGLFAMLMHKVANFFEGKGLHRSLSALVSTLMVFVIVIGLSILLVRQLFQFSEDLPEIQERIMQYYENLRDMISEKFGIPHEEQEKFIQERGNDLISNSVQIVQSTVRGIMSMFGGFLLVLIYLFLMLLNRDKYVNVIKQLASEERKESAVSIGLKVSMVAQKYLWGRIQVMTILGIMYLITFIAFDIQYIYLLTIFGALITIIPYIGPLISGVLPVLVAIITGEQTSTILFLGIVVLIIQLIESYVLEPLILSSEVNLSPLAIIVAILAGGSIWGIAGMILFVPMLSMVKIYFDHTDNLKPYGVLIGSSSSQKTTGMVKKMFAKLRGKG
jgi:predicted PurR-regulated permease PerM